MNMPRPRPLLAVLAVAALVLSDCSQPKDDEPDPIYAEVSTTERSRAVDLLFVVDNTGTMSDEQEIIAEQVEVLVRELLVPSTDLHIGVVTTDMGVGGNPNVMCPVPAGGDNGLLQSVGRHEGCRVSYSAPDCSAAECPWLTHSAEFPNDGSDPSDPPVWEDFGCIVRLGTEGCAFEQPFEASLVALTTQLGPGQANEGFLRHDSVLSIIYITDEDDCSAEDPEILYDSSSDVLGPANVRCALNDGPLQPVERYVEELRGLVADPNDLVVAAITGVPIDGSWSPGDPLEELRDLQRVNPDNPNELMPSCQTDMGLAFPPVRIAEFIYSFDSAGILGSICRDDWSDTMMSIARAIQSRMIYECYELSEDIDPATECRLIEILSDGTEREIPHEAEGVEGWSIGSTARGCPSGQLQFSDGVEIDGEVRLECVVVEEE